MSLNALSPRFLVLLALFSIPLMFATPLHYRSHLDALGIRAAAHPKARSGRTGSSLGSHSTRAKGASSGSGGRPSSSKSGKRSSGAQGSGGATSGANVTGKAVAAGSGGDLTHSLFPVGTAVAKWTTASGSGSLPLSDATLVITKKGQPAWSYVTFAGKKAIKAHYPKGSYRPGAPDAPKGGISFYASGPKSVDLTTAKEATFGYSVYFPQGFTWVLGGKLPGFYGGDDPTVAVGCSGGRRDVRCFSSRLMWRPQGAGELYTYLPPYTVKGFEANGHFCKDKNTECNPTYGASIGRGEFHFKAGAWTTVSERVKLNTPGKADGEIELYIEGKSTIKVTGIIIRDSDKGRIRGIQMQSFFGGSQPKWATPKDQDVYFADLSVAITQKL